MDKNERDSLLRAWDAAKSQGLTKKEFAQKIGQPYNQIRMILYRAENARDKERSKQPFNPPPDDDPIAGFTINQDGNYLEVEYKPKTDDLGRVTTLEGLLQMGQVDLETWEVERWILNKWEVGAKTAKRRLVWEDGQIIEGSIDDPGTLTIEPLIQVKAWLIRKKPLAINPTIQPVGLAKFELWTPAPGLSDLGKQIKSALILPDPQFGFKRDLATGRLIPFHDRAALSVALQIAKFKQFDRVVYLGDWLDLAEWSDKFLRSPEHYFTTQPAIIESAWYLAQMRAAQPGAEMDLIEGNHESRFQTAIAAHLPYAYQLKPAHEALMDSPLSIPYLLDLDSLGIHWVGDYPNGQVWLSDSLVCEHGRLARNEPGATSKAVAAAAYQSTIFGHIHRIERATRTLESRHGAKRVFAVSPGCLCRTDFVVPGHNRGQNWQQGVAIAYYDDSGFESVEVVAIEDGMAVWGGEVFRSEDYLPALAQFAPNFDFA